MNTEQIRASDAENLLANPVFKGAMKAMKDKLDSNIAGVNPDNKEQCARTVLAVQVLNGIEREIHRFIKNGEVADLIELQSNKKLTVVQRVTGKLER